MAVKFVQGVSVSTAGSSSISPVLNGVATGNCLIAAMAYYSAGSLAPSSVGDGTNTYTGRVTLNYASATNQIRLYTAHNATGGNRTLTVSFGANVAGVFAFAEFSGVDQTYPGDVFSTRTGTSTAPLTNATAIPSYEGSMALALLGMTSAQINIGIDLPAGYTNVAIEQNGITSEGFSLDYKALPSRAAENPNWGTTTSGSWGGVVYVLRPAVKSVSVVQTASNTVTWAAPASSVAVTLNGVQAGNRLVAIAVSYGSNTQQSVSDTAGNTWVKIASSGIQATSTLLTVWITKNKVVSTGNTTVTIAAGANSAYQASVMELANVSEFYDVRVGSPTGTGTSRSTGTSPTSTIPHGITIGAYAAAGPGVVPADTITEQAGVTEFHYVQEDDLHSSFVYRLDYELGTKALTWTESNASLTVQPALLVYLPVETPRWSLVAIGAATTVTSGNISPTIPAETATDANSLAEGDLFVAAIAYRSNVAFAAPSGWAIHQQESTGNTSTTTNTSIGSGLIASIKRGASNPANTFTRTLGDVGFGRIFVYRATDCDDWEFDVSSSATLGANGTVVSTAGLTTQAPLDLIVAAMCGADNTTASAFDAATDPTIASAATNTTAPPTFGTWYERVDSNTTSGADTTLAFADAVRFSAGATGTIQCTAAASSRHVIVAAAFSIIDAVSVTAGVGTISLAGQTAEFSAGGAAPHTATPGAGTLTLAGQAPAAAAASSMSPGAGTLTLAGQAPTVVAGTSFSATPGNGSLTLDGFAPSVATAVGAAPGAGTISLAGQAPSAAAAANTTPGSGALAVDGFAPTVAAGTSFSAAPGNGTLALDGFAATSAGAVGASPGTGALTVDGFAPTLSAGSAFEATPGTGTLSLEGRAPAVATAVSASPSTGALTVAGQAPAVSTAAAAAPGAGAISLAGQAPTAAAGVSASSGAGAITVDGFAATVSAGESFDAAPGNGAITVEGSAPSASAAATAEPGTSALTLAGQSATVSGAVSTSPGTGAITLAGQAPSASAAAEATPGTGSTTVEGYAPTLVSGFSTQAGAGALTLSGFDPVLDIGGSFTAQAGAGSLTVDGFAPSVVSGAILAVGGGALVLAGQAATAESGEPANALPGTGVLTAEGQAPTGAAGAHITAATGAHTLDAQAASVAAAATAAPGIGALVFSGYAPEVTSASGEADIEAGFGEIEIAGFAPLITLAGADGATLIIEEGPVLRATVAVLDIPVRSVVETTASLSAVELPKFLVEIDERRAAPRVAIPVGA